MQMAQFLSSGSSLLRAYGELVVGPVISLDDLTLASANSDLNIENWNSRFENSKSHFAGEAAQIVGEIGAPKLSAGCEGNECDAESNTLFSFDDTYNNLLASDNSLLYSGGKISIETGGSKGVVFEAGATLAADGDITIESSGNLLLSSSWNKQEFVVDRTAIVSNGSIAISLDGSLRTNGALISAREMVQIVAGRWVFFQGARRVFELTPEMGCAGRACGNEGFDVAPSEVLAGSSMIISAGRSVLTEASHITSGGSMHIHARDRVSVTAESGAFYLKNRDSRRKLFGFISVGSLDREEVAVVRPSEIQSLFGSIDIRSDSNNIQVKGSKLSAGGDLSLSAKGDISLEAVAEETEFKYQKAGFSFIAYANDIRSGNEFLTVPSQVEGDNVTLNAGTNLKVIGSSLVSFQELAVRSEGDFTSDAHQNLRFLTEKGFSIGLDITGLPVIERVLDGESPLNAYIKSNGTLAAVHKLATADDEWGYLNGSLALLWNGTQTLGDANRDFRQIGTQGSLGGALAKQFIPQDLKTIDGLVKKCGESGPASSECVFSTGIGLRASWTESDARWTESHKSRLIAMDDLSIYSGRDVSLMGGTEGLAEGDISIGAGRNFLMSALADNVATSNNSWGASIAVSDGGITLGVEHAEGESSSTLFTNAILAAGFSNKVAAASGDAVASCPDDLPRSAVCGRVTDETSRERRSAVVGDAEGSGADRPTVEVRGGEGTRPAVEVEGDGDSEEATSETEPNDPSGTIDIFAGNDASFFGANVRSDYLFMDIGQDLRVVSRQDTEEGSQWGFNAGVTFCDGPVPCKFTGGGNFYQREYEYAKTPTWIEAEDTARIDVGRATFLMGAVLSSKSGDLILNTDAFMFDHFQEKDRTTGFSGNISISRTNPADFSGSANLLHRDSPGITYATISGGSIIVRSNPDMDVSGVNTDIDTVHEKTDGTYINIELPGLNPKTLVDNINETRNFLRALGPTYRTEFEQRAMRPVLLYERMIANGLSFDEAQAVAKTPEFAEAAHRAGVLAEAREAYGDDIPKNSAFGRCLARV